MYLAKRWRTLAAAGCGWIAVFAHAAAPVLSVDSNFGGRAQFSFTTVDAAIFQGDACRFQILATGATSFDVQGLPAGLDLDHSTGVISGVPTQAGNFPLTITASNADGTSTANATLTIEPAPTGKPEVTAISDRESWYYGSYLGNSDSYYYDTIVLSATQRPTSYTIDGFPGGELDVKTGPADGTAKYAVVVVPKGKGAPGIHTCTVTATNEYGSGTTSLTWKVDPALIDFGISSDKSAYYLGDTIRFQAKFTGPVIVTGQPSIGTNNGAAAYVSGSGTDTLTFECPTKASDASFSGYVPQTIALNGGTITSVDGLPAHLTAPSLRDTVPPSYRYFAASLANNVGTGSVGVAFGLFQGNQAGAASFAVIRGVLPDGLSIDGGTGDITGTPTKAGTYPFTVQATAPSGSTNTADFSITINADGTPTPIATITSVTGPAPGYRNTSFYLYANYNSPVIVTGTPSLTVNIGSQQVQAKYLAGSTSAQSQLSFWCYVNGGPAYDGPVTVVSPVSLNGGTIRANGQDASLDFTPPDLSGVVVDTTLPDRPTLQVDAADPATPTFFGTAEPASTVSIAALHGASVILTATADATGAWRAPWSGAALAPGTYDFNAVATDRAGNNGYASPVVSVTVPASAPAATGAPTITSPDSFDCDYYADNPSQPEGTVTLTATGSPTWTATTSWGGTITSYGELSVPIQKPGAYTADVTATNAKGSTSQHLAIRVHPAVVGVATSKSTVYHVGETFTITLTCNVAVSVTGTPAVNLMLLGDHSIRKAQYQSGNGTNTLEFSYTVAPDDPSGDFTFANDAPFDFGAGGITAAGLSLTNYLPLRQYAQPTRIDSSVSGGGGTTPPPGGSTPAPTDAKSDQTITFSSPAGAIIVGESITLGAVSSAGLPITYTVVSGDATLRGNTLTPKSTATLIIRASSAGNATVNAASVDVNFGTPEKAAQSISIHSAVVTTVPAEQPLALSATSSSGLPVTYSVVSGPATLSGNTLTFTGTGNVTVRASQVGDGTYAAAKDVTLTYTAIPVNRLVNLSSRVHIAAGDAAQGAIAGFVVAGDAPKQLLIRAVGPSLSTYGVESPLATPQLEVFDAKGNSVAVNHGWADDAQIASAGDAVGAFKLASGSRDAALLVTLAPGLYTAQVKSADSGTALVEVYDVAAKAAVPTKQLINISTRGTVGAGDDAVIAGFVVAGAQPKRVLIRGVGPGLAAFNVGGVLGDPMLKLYDSKGTVLARNDDWETSVRGDVLQFSTTPADVTAADTAAGAFALQPGSKDAALVLTLDPGAYTVILAGAQGGGGAALIEVYELP